MNGCTFSLWFARERSQIRIIITTYTIYAFSLPEHKASFKLIHHSFIIIDKFAAEKRSGKRTS